MNSQYLEIKSCCLRCLVSLLRAERVSNKNAPHYTDGKPTLTEVTFDSPDFTGSPLEILDTEDIYRLGIVRIPTETVNLLVCAKLSKHFDLSQMGVFINIEDSWRLDISERFALSNGFLLPLRTKRNKYYGLKVYRSPFDKKPFNLRARENVNA